jgi:hypothetical protein
MRRRTVQIPLTLYARQSKTLSEESHYSSARRQSAATSPKRTTVKENEMGIISGRRLLLGAVIASSVGIGYAIGAQPHMAETITLLQTARAELVKATPNKGGHRERALGLIDQAIGEVRAGMNFAAGN